MRPSGVRSGLTLSRSGTTEERRTFDLSGRARDVEDSTKNARPITSYPWKIFRNYFSGIGVFIPGLNDIGG